MRNRELFTPGLSRPVEKTPGSSPFTLGDSRITADLLYPLLTPDTQAVVGRSLISFTIAALLVSACGPSKQPRPPERAAASTQIPAELRVRTAGTVKRVPLESYVAAAILSEVSPVGDAPDAVARIFEVQAIVARTYAIAQLGRHHGEGFDLCDTTHCQRYEPARLTTSRFSADAQTAAARTAGRVITYGGTVAETLFHSDCGGQTANAFEVWGVRTVPYLQVIDDHPVPAETHRAWRHSATTDELRAALNADSRTAVGARLDSIEIASRDDSGRAAGLSVRGARSYAVRGDVLRAVLNRSFGERAIQSTRFTLTKTGVRHTFEGTGFGHGVGLCQRGAMARARTGQTAPQILQTYFPGTRISQ